MKVEIEIPDAVSAEDGIKIVGLLKDISKVNGVKATAFINGATCSMLSFFQAQNTLKTPQ